MASYTVLLSQGLNNNCELVNPTDTTGVIYEAIEFTPSTNFPNWHMKPFVLYGGLRYGSAFGNKMEIVLNDAIFINNYTTDAGNPYNALNGIDTKSMKEFAKEKYRKDVLEVFLKNQIPCTESTNFYVFSFITKKDCYKDRICKLKLSEFHCCSDSIDQTNFFTPSEGEYIEIINGDKYLIVKRRVSCNERSCCEERYHYVCNENAQNPNDTWVLQYKDFVTYTGTECSPNVINNPNCQFYNPSTCKSGCGN